MSSLPRNTLPPSDDYDGGEQYPAPLEFITTDAIHPDNLAVLEHAQRRWRLLTFRERLRMRRVVAALAKELKRGRYNERSKRLYTLWLEYRRLKAAYKATTFISREAREDAKQRIIAVRELGRIERAALDEMNESYQDYQHYTGWLEYEQMHRRELRAEAKLDRSIKKKMNREAALIESLMISVFKHTPGCHYTYTDKNGKLVTKAPKFERSVVKPDAHWFYLAASKKVLFGWKWKLPNGVMISRLTDDDVIENLRAALHRQVDVVWSDTNQIIFRVARLDSPDALPRLVKWRDAMRYFPQEEAEDLPYSVGVTESKRFKWFDFDSIPHILIAGRSQSGKSNLVNGIVATLASTHTPDELRLVLIDMKGGVEMTHWEESPHLLWEVVKSVEEVEPFLKRLVTVMRHRFDVVAAVKVKSFKSYNRRVGESERWARVLIVIDEMNTFMGLPNTSEIHQLINLLVSQGRVVGMHVIASTQYPDAAVIPPRIKSNMALRMSGQMPSVTASMVILDNPEAARLPNMPGRFAITVGREDTVVQVPMITDEDIAGVISSTLKAYPDVSNELRDASDMKPLQVWDEQRVIGITVKALEGKLSADAIHHLMGSESPGERTLRKLCTSIKDEYQAAGYLTLVEDNTRWTIQRKGKAYYLRQQVLEPGKADGTDEVPHTPTTEAVPALASVSEPEPVGD